MAEMTQTQIKYLRQRADVIMSEKIRAVTETFTTPAVELTLEEKLQAIKDGQYRVTGDKNHYWAYAIRFDREAPRKVDQKGIDRARAQIAEQYRALLDELILGDNVTALELLKAFEA